MSSPLKRAVSSRLALRLLALLVQMVGGYAVTPAWAAYGAAGLAMPALLLPLIPIAVFLTLWHLLTAHNVVAWLRFNRMPAPEAVFHTLLTRASSGGFYDDLLARLTPRLAPEQVVAAAFELQIVPEVPTRGKDISVPYVITEKRLIRAQP